MYAKAATVRRTLFASFLLVLLATAWVGDDAYISFRTLDHFVDGRGLTWNPGERVQAFTHPLWFLLHAGLVALTGEVYYTTLVVSFACSISVVFVLAYRLAGSAAAGVLLLLVLVCSRAFVDYSTSGLENPLIHLLLVLLVGWGWNRGDGGQRLLVTAAAAALLCLTRLDLVLLALPALVVQWYWCTRLRERMWALLILGLPLLAWELFSLVYFGSLVPNTAAAKLGTGVSAAGKLLQGLNYFGSSLLHDGVTLLAIGWCARRAWQRRTPQDLAVVVGMLGYLGYLALIGGDSMAGRFLSAPLVMMLANEAKHLRVERAWLRPGVVAGLVVVLAVGITAGALAKDGVDSVGVGDERRVWYPSTGLVFALFEEGWPGAGWYATRRDLCEGGGCLRIELCVGLVGYYADPDVTIIDRMALTDPFRARLPGLRGSSYNLPGRPLGWRPGHVERPIPAGLAQSLLEGRNLIEDPDLAELYDAVSLVTRGQLWTRDRWREIWRLNTGWYDGHVQRWAQRHPEWYGGPGGTIPGRSIP